MLFGFTGFTNYGVYSHASIRQHSTIIKNFPFLLNAGFYEAYLVNSAVDFDNDFKDEFFAIRQKVTFNGVFASLVYPIIYKQNANLMITDSVVLALPSAFYNNIPLKYSYCYPGDYNGDGFKDIILILYDRSPHDATALANLYIAYGQASNNLLGPWSVMSLTSGSQFTTLSNWRDVEKISIIDFNGDGKNEIFAINGNISAVFDVTSSTLTQKWFSNSTFSQDDIMFFADFNGDSKTDLLRRTSLTNNAAPWFLAYSSGTNWTAISQFNFVLNPALNNNWGDWISTGDANGDGRSDITIAGRLTATQTYIDVYFSKGIGFTNNYRSVYTYAHGHRNLDGIYDMNGDGRSDVLAHYQQDAIILNFYIKKNGKELLLNSVKNGEGHTLVFDYKNITQPFINNNSNNFYTRGVLSNNVISNFQFPTNLVYQFKVDNGIGGIKTQEYFYNSLKIHKTGKGILGFERITVYDYSIFNKNISEFIFNQTKGLAIPSYTSMSYFPSSPEIKLNETFSDYSVLPLLNNRFYLQKNFDEIVTNLEDKKVKSTILSIDQYGNILTNKSEIFKKVNGSYTLVESSTTTSTFGMFGSPIPDKPLSVNIINKRTGENDYSKSNQYQYLNNGKVKKKIEFAGTAKALTTDFTYYTHGGVDSTIIKAAGMQNRFIKKFYDNKGKFITSEKNSLGQTASSIYDIRWGKPTSITGIDGLTFNMTYDAFGRLINTIHPEGYSVILEYGWDINNATKSVSTIKIINPGRPDKKTWFDNLGREIKTETEGFVNNGILDKILTEISYYSNGLLQTEKDPYIVGEPNLIKTFSYDVYNRLSSVISNPNNFGIATTTYNFINGEQEIIMTNPANQVSSKKTDASGKLLSSTDYGGTINYTYCSHGGIRTVTNDGVLVDSVGYDIYGQKILLFDKNAGVTTYDYDAFGQLIKEVKANHQSLSVNKETRYRYDIIGRIISKKYPVSNDSTTFEYFPSGSGASTNKIKKIRGFGGDVEEYTYDIYGRLSTKKITYDGKVNNWTFTYDIYNNIKSITYPSGVLIKYNYDINGYLISIKNTNETTTYLTINSINGRNQVTKYTMGNGKQSILNYFHGINTRYFTPSVQDLNLTWNYLSMNINSRNDAIKNLTETFTYDNLNRLNTWQVGSGTLYSTNFANNGNITNKTEIGSYVYDINKNNAVKEVANSSNIVSGPHNITHNNLLKPSQITDNNVNGYLYEIKYGNSENRIKTTMKLNFTDINRKYYFDNYEIDSTAGVTKHYHYISAVGLNFIIEKATSETVYYTYTDHLGSITAVTNTAGTVISEQNFDPWGRRRNTNNWTYTSISNPPGYLYRGFTGHEHIDQFQLINMNARLYDPLIGRMLSPDKYMQDVSNSQNLNRYTYAMNNPIKYVDPDGNEIVTFLQ